MSTCNSKFSLCSDLRLREGVEIYQQKFISSALEGSNSQSHAPAVLPPEKGHLHVYPFNRRLH
jgi:hypothetical protein